MLIVTLSMTRVLVPEFTFCAGCEGGAHMNLPVYLLNLVQAALSGMQFSLLPHDVDWTDSPF